MNLRRTFFLIAGYLSLVLGFIGVFLPIFPTTPFVLLAAFCFSKGSPRMHRWILENPVFGPLVKDWDDGGIIRPRAKFLATFFILVSFTSLTLFTSAPRVGKVLLDLFAVAVLVFIWSRPSAKVERKEEQ